MARQLVSARKNGDLATIDTNAKPPWGTAHPRRGASHEDLATTFITDHPIGTQLSSQQFDEWAQAHGVYKTPPACPKNSDPWLAHLQRRHILRKNLNNAGAHPRMDCPFAIESARGRDYMEVKSIRDSIGKVRKLENLETLMVTNIRKLNHLMQSADWPGLPVYERMFAEAVHDEIKDLLTGIGTQIERVKNRYDKLEAKLRQGVEDGTILVRNGGIKGIIGPVKRAAK